MDDLLKDFTEETRDMMAAIAGEIVAWEGNPADRDRLDAIFRFVHTVKGNCGFFDLPRIEALAHAAENILAQARKGERAPDAAMVNAVLAVLDRIVTLVDALESGEAKAATAGPDDSALIAALVAAGSAASAATLPLTAAKTLGDAPAAAPAPTSRSIRLPVELLDSVMGGVSDLVMVRNELARHLGQIDMPAAAGTSFDRLTATLDQLREGIGRMRMQRLDHLFGPLPRLVRDLSLELGKDAALELDDGQVELDREMIELIRDPLVHLLRNALDHGIELPEQRRQRGKPPQGCVALSARQTGNAITIVVRDDGRGIDTDRLLSKAIAAGLVSADAADKMSEADRLALIFRPGLSSAEQVTAISGRGVGMDIVRANVERFGGTITIASTLGEGTRIVLTLPATLAIIPALTVRVGGQFFGIPQSYVEEIISKRAAAPELTRVGDARVLRYRGQLLPCLSLAAVLGLAAESEPTTELISGAIIIIRLASGDHFALAVNSVVNHEDLVIKALPPEIVATNLYTGSSLLDDGQLVLMLYIGGIAQRYQLFSHGNSSSPRTPARAAAPDAQAASVPALLFVGLDGQRRLIRADSVARVEQACWSAVQSGAAGDRIVLGAALYPLAGPPDGFARQGELIILRCTDGVRSFAYAIAAVIDTVELTHAVQPSASVGAVAGVTLFEGAPVEFLDSHWLFAHVGQRINAAPLRTCAMDLSDGWTRSFLVPVVEAAGYRVIDTDSANPAAANGADIALMIASADDAAASGEPADPATRPIQVVRFGDAAQGGPDGIGAPAAQRIDRYDRQALLALLLAQGRQSA